MVAYDIADASRLVKIFRLLKKEGLAIQKSLFFVHGNEDHVNKLLDRIASLMKSREDDLRAYPITHPKEVWTNGPNPLADFPVVYFGEAIKKHKKKDLKRKKRKHKKRQVWHIV